MPKILSTLTASNDYLFYDGQIGNGINNVVKRITVNGGANVASAPHALANGLLTPGHIVTEVSDEDLQLLKKNEHFLFHQKNGFVQIVGESVNKREAEKIVKEDMEKKDNSAPFTDADYKEGGRAQAGADLAVKTGKVK